MILIAHRGNVSGVNPAQENHPRYLLEALTSPQLHVELDLWCLNNSLYTGHDRPLYEINLSFFKNERIWCHCKNEDALKLAKKENLHFFWHDSDTYTMTSHGIIWCHADAPYLEESVLVLPERRSDEIIKNIYGICSDIPWNFT